MVRFLSVFPKPGGESLLKAATSKFEKLRRESYRHAMKLDEEECQQPNLGLEEHEELDNAEDEEEAAEGNDSEEEWEEELDLELFGSFPHNEVDGANLVTNGSDEEYHIYEEDSEENYSDE
ncbi:hypothetical protein V8G54_015513 [Vigna mungo]|uniref:Uncharacterized protein n=1 Tax=Vigna mungo TaxID=3915 RepID=A0AAQ3RZK6_VIGMU